MRTERYAVIDTETTGLDPDTHSVLSLAVVPVAAGSVRYDRGRQVLVDPGVPIPAASTAVHGICDDDVAGAPALAAALAELAPMLAGAIVVGHNLEFDLAFLRAGGLAVGQTLDTLAVSRLLWPLPGTRHRLEDVAARVGVSPVDRHTALGDAIATAEVLVACLPLLESRGLTGPEAVAEAYRAQRLRRARVKRSIRRRSSRRRRPAASQHR